MNEGKILFLAILRWRDTKAFKRETLESINLLLTLVSFRFARENKSKEKTEKNNQNLWCVFKIRDAEEEADRDSKRERVKRWKKSLKMTCD